jgi:hypothetical protein
MAFDSEEPEHPASLIDLSSDFLPTFKITICDQSGNIDQR